MEIVALLGEVIYPAFAAMLRDGELEGLHVYNDASGSDSFVILEARVVGELLKTHVFDRSAADQTVAGLRARLESDIADFVAESKFGWGQQRFPA